MLSFVLSYYACLLIELVYPTYASLKAIQSHDSVDDRQWLTYWVVYAVISTFQSLASFILAWVPGYWEIKIFVVLWMIAPQTQGARVIYEKGLVPFLVKYGHKLDPIFGQAEAALKSGYVGQIANMVDKYGPTIAEQALKSAQENAAKAAQFAQAAAEQHMQNQRKDL